MSLKISYNNALFDDYNIITTMKRQLNFYTSAMKKIFGALLTALLAVCMHTANAQDETFKGMSKEAYEIAKTAVVEDLDSDTYVKIGSGDYVLDRYEMKPPYFITGDSGIKKRIDIYKLIERADMGELGLVVFFTDTEAKETFNLVIPSMVSKGEVWNMYFDDIHQHDREEGDVALKMSYILSKEVAYLMQKSSGVDMSAMDQDNDDYDFCFSPDALVSMADGTEKPISQIVPGDVVLTLSEAKVQAVKVEAIDIHRKKNISLAKAILFPVEAITASASSQNINAEAVELIATANHPVLTLDGAKALGELQAGDILLRYDAQSGEGQTYRVHFVAPAYDSVEEVYNLEVEGDSYLVNQVLVLEK